MGKLEDLRKLIDTELNKARKHAAQTKLSANEISRTAAASPSQSGDREHSTNQAFITEDRLNRLTNTLEELEQTVESKDREKVLSPVYLTVELQSKEQQFYLLSNPMHIAGTRIISVNSPLGRALVNKKLGKEFQYKVGNISVKGKIIDMEF